MMPLFKLKVKPFADPVTLPDPQPYLTRTNASQVCCIGNAHSTSRKRIRIPNTAMGVFGKAPAKMYRSTKPDTYVFGLGDLMIGCKVVNLTRISLQIDSNRTVYNFEYPEIGQPWGHHICIHLNQHEALWRLCRILMDGHDFPKPKVMTGIKSLGTLSKGWGDIGSLKKTLLDPAIEKCECNVLGQYMGKIPYDGPPPQPFVPLGVEAGKHSP